LTPIRINKEKGHLSMHTSQPLRTSAKSASLSVKPLVAALVALAIAGHAHAAVNGGTVAAGSATINTQGATTTINQSSDRAVINWRSFNVGAGEKVQINQPRSTSAILNRVDGSLGGTRIDGEINANGQVFLVNAKGVSVGSGGKINAAGVVLSSLDIGDDNFMRPVSPWGDTLYFSRAASAPEARVVNDGTITAGDAGISLFGGQVINSATGTLQAAGGLIDGTVRDIHVSGINLVAADALRADQYINSNSTFYKLIQNGLYVDTFSVSSTNNAKNLVANDGRINVQNGPVLLKAAQNGDEIAVRNTGAITATNTLISNTIVNNYSNLQIESGDKGAVHVGGNIRTSGDVSLASRGAPLIVDGSIITDNRVVMSAYNNGNIAINAGANVQAGRNIQVLGYGPNSSVSVDGELSSPGGVTVFDKLSQ
jgi:filamentous hemagglutinin family protein